MMNKTDKRNYPRVCVPTNKAVIQLGEKLAEVQIGNISQSGALFHSDQSFSLGDQVILHITGIYRGVEFNEHVRGKIVTAHRRTDGNAYGLQFSMLLDMNEAPVLLAFLDSGQRNKVSFLRDPRYGKAERK